MSGREPVPNVQAYQGVKAVNPPEVLVSARSPNSNDKTYQIGTLWVNSISHLSYQLVGNPGHWALLGEVEGPLETLTTSDAAVVAPVGGNINIEEGSNILTTGAGSTVTISVSDDPEFSSITTTGSVVVGDFINAQGNILSATGGVGGVNVVASNTVTAANGLIAVDGGLDIQDGGAIIRFGDLNVVNGTINTNAGININSVGGVLLLGGSGSHIQMKSLGSEDFLGQEQLEDGEVFVDHDTITDECRIFLQRQSFSGTPGFLTCEIEEEVGFTIRSTSATDDSLVSYFIVEEV